MSAQSDGQIVALRKEKRDMQKEAKEVPVKIEGTEYRYRGREYVEYENLNCDWCACSLPLGLITTVNIYVWCEFEYCDQTKDQSGRFTLRLMAPQS